MISAQNIADFPHYVFIWKLTITYLYYYLSYLSCLPEHRRLPALCVHLEADHVGVPRVSHPSAHPYPYQVDHSYI